MNENILFRNANNHAPWTRRTEFQLSQLEQRIRFILVLNLSFVLFLILIGIPAIRYFMPAKMNDTDSYKLYSIINNKSHLGEQSERNTVLRMDNIIFLTISIVLSIIFLFLNTQDQSDDGNQSSILFFFHLKFIFNRIIFYFRNTRTY